MRRLALAASLLVFTGCAASRAEVEAPEPELASWILRTEAQPRTDTLTPHDVVAMRLVLDVEMSPNGKQVAYTLRVPRPLDDPGRGRGQIWIAPADGRTPPRPLTDADHTSSQPRWSPDGQRLAFTSGRPGDDGSQVYALDMKGGEAVQLFESSSSVAQYAWSPDGKSIAYTSYRATQAQQEDIDGKRDWIVDESGTLKARLFVRDLESGEEREVVTSGEHVIDFEWSPDGKRFAVRASDLPTTDRTMMYSELFTVDASGGALTPLTKTEGKLGHMAWSPDGAQIAYLGALDIHDPTAGVVWVVPSGGGTARALTHEFAGTGNWIGWESNEGLLFHANVGTKTNLFRVSTKGGEAKPALSETPICHDVSIVRGQMACAGDEATHDREVYAGKISGRRLLRATVSNPTLASKQLGEQSVVKWKAEDGLEIEGILIKPVGYQKGQRYPLAILVHGGPEGVSQDGWGTRATYPAQLLAARGYVVLMPNYRGSQGRGVAFGKADHNDLGGKEFTDVLAGIEYLHGEGLIDKDRVGMGGWSYGGYFSGLAATLYSEHFKAAVICAAVIDWISFTGTTEIEHENSLVHWNQWVWDDVSLPWERSPLAHVAKSKTPALVVHGLADARVPPGQALEIYRGLKHHGVETQLVQYPREPHGLVENVHSLDFINRWLTWFDRHVKG